MAKKGSGFLLEKPPLSCLVLATLVRCSLLHCLWKVGWAYYSIAKWMNFHVYHFFIHFSGLAIRILNKEAFFQYSLKKFKYVVQMLENQSPALYGNCFELPSKWLLSYWESQSEGSSKQLLYRVPGFTLLKLC